MRILNYVFDSYLEKNLPNLRELFFCPLNLFRKATLPPKQPTKIINKEDHQQEDDQHSIVDTLHEEDDIR